MCTFENHTPYASLHTLTRNAQGQLVWLLVAKASYTWNDEGRCQLASAGLEANELCSLGGNEKAARTDRCAENEALRARPDDEARGAPQPPTSQGPASFDDRGAAATPGGIQIDDLPCALHPAVILEESDLVPEKPRADVLMAGGLHLLPSSSPKGNTWTLSVGSAIHKQLPWPWPIYPERGISHRDRRAHRPSKAQCPPSSKHPSSFGLPDADDPHASRPHIAVRSLPLCPACLADACNRGFAPRRVETTNSETESARTHLPCTDLPAAGPPPPTLSPLFGPRSRGDARRARFAGTMNEAWRHQRFPLPPLDFDARFFQSSPEDQQCAHAELVHATLSISHGATTFRPGRDAIRFTVPSMPLKVTWNLSSDALGPRPSRPDTLRPDTSRPDSPQSQARGPHRRRHAEAQVIHPLPDTLTVYPMRKMLTLTSRACIPVHIDDLLGARLRIECAS